jgi:hypothetical protein
MRTCACGCGQTLTQSDQVYASEACRAATAGVGGTLGDGGGAYALVDDDETWQATMRGQLAAG